MEAAVSSKAVSGAVDFVDHGFAFGDAVGSPSITEASASG